MYIIINAPNGTLDDECSIVGTYSRKRDAQRAMRREIKGILRDFGDDPHDCDFGDYHGMCYLNRTDPPAWHIFKV